jgi:hypothetical protein
MHRYADTFTTTGFTLPYVIRDSLYDLIRSHSVSTCDPGLSAMKLSPSPSPSPRGTLAVRIGCLRPARFRSRPSRLTSISLARSRLPSSSSRVPTSMAFPSFLSSISPLHQPHINNLTSPRRIHNALYLLDVRLAEKQPWFVLRSQREEGSFLNLRLSRSANFPLRAPSHGPASAVSARPIAPPRTVIVLKAQKFLVVSSPSLKNLLQGCTLSRILGLRRHTLTPDTQPARRTTPPTLNPHHLHRSDPVNRNHLYSLELPRQQR